MKCKHCGAEIELNYVDWVNDRLQARQECFICNHFTSAREEFPDTTLIICGEMFTVGEESTRSMSRGHAGNTFYFRFHDRSPIYKSTNLWHRGTIPPTLRPQMPDNAIWVYPNLNRNLDLSTFEILNH